MDVIVLAEEQRRRIKRPSTVYSDIKRRLDDDVAELPPAKRSKPRGGTAVSLHGDTCDNAESHFEADGDRSRQPSNVRFFFFFLTQAISLCSNTFV